jgi:hypothetical protein
VAARVGLAKDDVIATAVALADKNGFDNVTLSSVARTLGIRSQSLYAHVDALAGLRRELQLRAFRLLGERIREAVAGLSRRDAIVAWATAVDRFDREHPGLAEARNRAAGRDAQLRKAVREAEALPKELIRSYDIGEEDAMHYDRMVWSALYGFEDLRTAGRFRAPIDPDETLRRLIGALADDLERRERALRAARRHARVAGNGAATKRR